MEEDKNNKTPDWDIFGRIEGLEEIGLELMEKTSKLEELSVEELKQTANDGLILGLSSSIFAMTIAVEISEEEDIQGLLESYLNLVADFGLSEKMQKNLKSLLSQVK